MDDNEHLALQEKAIVSVTVWAQQTMCYAIGIRASETGNPFPIETKKQIGFVGKEMNSTIEELWKETQSEIADDTQLLSHEVFARKVFDWCYSHMNPEK